MSVRTAMLADVAATFDRDRWVNASPPTAADLAGKVVLIDIWEYTCVNWIRTAPYVKALHRDYADTGLVVLGVHAPEFEFGEQAGNIDRGIRDHALTYPIAIDNGYAIWQALNNHAWPVKYLFDARGNLVQRWVGEGRYDEVESEVRQLLVAADMMVSLPPTTPEVMAFAKQGEPYYAGITAETYVGAERGEPGTFTVDGDWILARQYLEVGSGTASLVLPFTAGEVNLVVEPGPSGSADIVVMLDDAPVDEAAGVDVDADGVARVDRAGMVRLVAGAPPGPHELTLTSADEGLRAYVFTFGP